MNVKLDIIEIWAYGSSKRFMYVLDPITIEVRKIRINQAFYDSLKEIGIPTAQSRRRKK